jgi:hypothetical protein
VNVQSILGGVTIGKDTSGDFKISSIPVPTVEAGDSIITSEDLLGVLQVLFVKSVASAGINTVSTKLPHLDRIQSSFGKHDITNAQAHLAPGANATLGAVAYTMGNHVAFAQSPSLRIAAHEATHVVQQRAGVQLQGGVGRTGDKYEQQADQVANEVVSGRSAEGILDRIVDEANCPFGPQEQAVQFWGPQHKDFTRRAIERWNRKHPKGTPMHISETLKKRIVNCSDDPDHSGRALIIMSGGLRFYSDSRIYIDYIVGGKKRRRKKYAEASLAEKKKMEAAARKSVCASEGPSHGEGNRPNYGSGGSKVNHEWMMSQIKWANRLTWGRGFLSWAGAGQLGDAMHCAQDRGSHCEGNRHEGHDDVKDKLGMSAGSCAKHGYDTDCPECNKPGARKADRLSDLVLIEYAKLRKGKL